MKLPYIILIIGAFVFALNALLHLFDFRYPSTVIGDLITIEMTIFALSLTLGGILASMPKSTLMLRLAEVRLLKDFFNAIRISILTSLLSITISLFTFAFPEKGSIASYLQIINITIIITHMIILSMIALVAVNIIYNDNFRTDP